MTAKLFARLAAILMAVVLAACAAPASAPPEIRMGKIEQIQPTSINPTVTRASARCWADWPALASAA